jgi:methyl-accepting chemotaxis protein
MKSRRMRDQMKWLRLRVSGKIYAIIGLCFLSLIGLSIFQLSELRGSLEDQKKIELRHLGDDALGIASAEYAAAQRGEISVEQAKKTAAALIGALRYGKDNYYWINDLQVRMVMHPIKPELVGRNLADMKDPNGKHLFVDFVETVKRQGAGFVAYEWPKPGSAKPQPKLSYVVGFKPWGWVIGTGVYVDDLDQQIWSSAKRTVVIGLIAILCLGAITVFIARRMSSALKKIASVLNELANGNKAVDVPFADRGDEIGDTARAAKTFRENLLRIETMEAEQKEKESREHEAAMRQQKVDSDRQAQAAAERAKAAEELLRQQELQAKIQAEAAAERQKASEEQSHVLSRLAAGLKRLSEGDLTVTLDEGFSPEYRQIKDDFNAAIARLSETISAIMDSSKEVANATAEISASTTDLSQRTEEQAASLEETSASMEEMAATVKKNAENAQQANQSASETREVADRGGQVVAKAVDAMARIEESSGKISDIIGVIDEIARQTNLLALNAAVEAARAGDAGRGFAVVASEVRSLAQRSSQAAKDIKDLITNSSGQVKDGVELVNRAGTALTEIVDSIKKVAVIVSDIATASTEQATGIEEVNRALTQMDEVTQQNSALVEENAATAKTLEQHAKAMDAQVASFRLNGTTGQPMALRDRVDVQRPAAPRPQAVAKPSAALPPTRGPAAKTNGRGGPVGRMQAAIASAVNADSEWKDF